MINREKPRRVRSVLTVLLLVVLIGSLTAPVEAATPRGFLPKQIRAAYGVDQLPLDGSGEVIAVIGAYEYPDAATDLAVFSQTFGLAPMHGLPGARPCTVEAGPHPCFQYRSQESADDDPRVDLSLRTLWAQEMAGDIQWARAIAPGADILLVTARSSELTHMLQAVEEAVSLGASIVSMSWGLAEDAAHIPLNRYFRKPGVMFVAASGDAGTQLLFPASSPYVLAVGGTYLKTEVSGAYASEQVYNNGTGGSVGGTSLYQEAPPYQAALGMDRRSTPDVAWAAGPAGFATYVHGEWIVIGGTSMGVPQWAGLIALVNQAMGEPFSNISRIYQAAALSQSDFFHDVTEGRGACQRDECAAGPGYDYATGLGSPKADRLVPFLAGLPEPSPASTPESVLPPAAADFICEAEYSLSMHGSGYPSGFAMTLSLLHDRRYQVRVTGGAVHVRICHPSASRVMVLGLVQGP